MCLGRQQLGAALLDMRVPGCPGGCVGGRTLTYVDQKERIALFLDYENLALGAA